MTETPQLFKMEPEFVDCSVPIKQECFHEQLIKQEEDVSTCVKSEPFEVAVEIADDFLHCGNEEISKTEPKMKKERKKWNVESMKLAVSAVKEKRMGFKKASTIYNVPKSTLEGYVRSAEKDVEELFSTPLGRKQVLGVELEKELVQYCVEIGKIFFRLTIQDIKRLSFQLAVKNNLGHHFGTAREEAGDKWTKNFLKRNPTLPICKGSVSAKGFTKENVTRFYSLLEPELNKVNMKPDKVFNVDATGFTIRSSNPEVVTVKGEKQIRTLPAKERSTLTTLVTCMSPAGIFIPPLIIFPRQDMKPELLVGTESEAIGVCDRSGWIQAHIFVDWLQHFIDYVKPTSKDPVVLILDGHETNAKSLDVILKARESGVLIVSIPPNTSYKLQPIEVSFMSSFKRYYSQEVESWLFENPARGITSCETGPMMRRAYTKSATVAVAKRGFQMCGILPYDTNRFQESDFIPVP